MDISDLKTLVSVVENGSITKAAKELHRVPSGVTTRILRLEKALGTALFLREKKRLFVSPQGKLLYEYARRILDMLSEAEMQLKEKEPAGAFRIGAMESTAAVWLPKPLAKLHSLYPRLKLELTTGTSRFLYELLLDNRLDAAFVADAGHDDRIERMPAFDEKLVLITPAGHAPVNEPCSIVCGTILVFKGGYSYRSRLIRWFRAYGLEPGRIIELASFHAIMGGVAAGMGASVVPGALLQLFPDRHALSVHHFPHPLGKVLTELLWRKDMCSANLRALQECLRV